MQFEIPADFDKTEAIKRIEQLRKDWLREISQRAKVSRSTVYKWKDEPERKSPIIELHLRNLINEELEVARVRKKYRMA